MGGMVDKQMFFLVIMLLTGRDCDGYTRSLKYMQPATYNHYQ